ncbi:MAG TPA: LysM peptidoglycan-binding domain-containing protein [Lachnospiraceae bacterium]|nr:LysM peptidoglycan-binding domain-containing protein [Lachnospiraceae bacterium]
MDACVYESLDRSAYRSRRNKIKRMRLIRRRFILLSLTIILVLVLSISYHAILSEANTGDEETNYKYYTSVEVNYGESLWSIAEAHIGSEYASAKDYIHEVMEINHLEDEYVSAGQYLVIPYYSTDFKY